MDAISLEMTGLVQDAKADLARSDADLQASLRLLLAVILSGSVLGLLFALSFAYALYASVRQRMLGQIHLETEQTLRAQQETSRQLLLANGSLRDSEELLAVTLKSIGDAVMTTDARACVTASIRWRRSSPTSPRRKPLDARSVTSSTSSASTTGARPPSRWPRPWRAECPRRHGFPELHRSLLCQS